MFWLHSTASSLLLGLVAACSAATTTPPKCSPEAQHCPAVGGLRAEAEPPAPVPSPAAPVATVYDLQSAFKHAIAQAEPAVVSIYSTKTVAPRGVFGLPGDDPLDRFRRPQLAPRQFQQQGLGSGFVVDPQGYILTNNHVVQDADEIKVKLHDDREFDAEVVGTDPPTDLALLKVEGDELTAIEFGDSDGLEVGDWVLAIGNPFGLPRTVSSGIVSAKGRANVGIVDYENFIQTDAAVNPGNSGGPLVDLSGRVVGINTAIASRSGGNNGIAFAIPVNMAKSIVDQLRGDGRVVRGHLGVLISELSPEMATSFGFKGTDGILVQDVAAHSAADEAGVKDGDIVTELDGQRVSSVSAFRAEIANKRPGAAVRLEIWRGGSTHTVTAELAEAPGGGSPSAGAGVPRIGITLSDVDARLQRLFGLREPHGVVITNVEPGSEASRHGVRPGDVLEQVGATRVSNAQQAHALLRDADLQRGVRLRIARDGRGHFVLIRVAPR